VRSGKRLRGWRAASIIDSTDTALRAGPNRAGFAAAAVTGPPVSWPTLTIAVTTVVYIVVLVTL
jgi:hypothetical protein